MFKRSDRGSGIPFHDDNKYAKTPMGIHTKAHSRLRLRKRHAVLALCVFAATYIFFKSPTGTISLPSSSSSSSDSNSNLDNNNNGGLVPELDKAGPRKGQAEQKFVIPELHKAAELPGGDGGGSGAGTTGRPKEVMDNKVDDAAAKKAAVDKKKKKKKAPPTLFEFDGIDTPRKKPNKGSSSRNNNDRSKNLSKPKTPSPPKPVIEVAAPPPVKQQHQWGELNSNAGEDSDVGSVIDSSLSDTDDNDDHDSVDVDVNDDATLPPAAGRNRLPSLDAESRPPARSKPNVPLWEERKNKVKDAFLHSWNAYRRDAWGKDEYHPIAKYGTNMIRKGQGFTIVDSLDTILLMGLEKEFQEAKAWVRDELDFNQDGEVNLFETTIRVLGGLLSAYDQSGRDDVFLRKAVDLADRLMGAFKTASGIPYASVHLRDSRGVPSHDRGISSTSEVATLQLEFKYLSYLTGDDKYWKAAENVILKMKDLDSLDGLVPIFINPYTGKFQGGEIRLGSRGDSYYEYLIKQYLQTGKTESVYKDMYEHAIGGVKKHLLGRTIPHNLLFVGEISKFEPSNLSPKMDHLVCFLGGTMALASTEGKCLNPTLFPRSRLDRVQEEEFKIGEELTEACYEMYRQTETGLAPEIVYWVQNQEQTRGKSQLQHTPGSDFIINDRDGHNWLRPETIESLFYMWRLTGDDKYRHWGWKIFEAVEKYSKVPSGGFSSIHDIRRANNIHFSDKMETFFLAETLKYFYLLFGSNDVLPLDKYVFNTEAHPLPVFTPPEKFLTRTAPLSRKVVAHAAEKEAPIDSPDDTAAVSENNEDDEVVGVDDSILEEESGDNKEQQQPIVEGQQGDTSSSPTTPSTEEPGSLADEVDQGLEDIAIDGGEDGVEVDFEDNAAEGGPEQEAEEEDEEPQEGDEEDGDPSEEDNGEGEQGTDSEQPEEDDDRGLL